MPPVRRTTSRNRLPKADSTGLCLNVLPANRQGAEERLPEMREAVAPQQRRRPELALLADHSVGADRRRPNPARSRSPIARFYRALDLVMSSKYNQGPLASRRSRWCAKLFTASITGPGGVVGVTRGQSSGIGPQPYG